VHLQGWIHPYQLGDLASVIKGQVAARAHADFKHLALGQRHQGTAARLHHGQAAAEVDQPGKDVTVVSIDGMGFAFEAIKEGKLNCTVECNPLLGPMAFDAVAKALKGEELPKQLVQEDRLFDETNAPAELPNRKY
jgi:ABC-type sugar transport system substrate-binding protein